MSLRDDIRLAFARAAAKLASGETFVITVPNSLEVSREFTALGYLSTPDLVKELAELFDMRLADSDPVQRHPRLTLPPRELAREWRSSSRPPPAG
jgi:hypothetical protein